MPFRLADGGGQPGADLPLAGLDGYLRHGSHCGFRPPFLFFFCVNRRGGATVRAILSAGAPGKQACRHAATGVGIPENGAQPGFRDTDSQTPPCPGNPCGRPPVYGWGFLSNGGHHTLNGKKKRLSAKRLETLIRASLEDDQAQDIVIIDLKGQSDIADRLFIASGRSTRQVVAMAQHIVEKLKASGFGNAPVEGMGQGDWVLVDAGAAVVHLFRPEIRAFYNLEKMWGLPLPDDHAASEAARSGV